MEDSFNTDNERCFHIEESYWDYLMDEAEKYVEPEAEADFSGFAVTKENFSKSTVEK